MLTLIRDGPTKVTVGAKTDFKSLSRFLLDRRFIVPIVPEVDTVTVGGAISGVATQVFVESFCHVLSYPLLVLSRRDLPLTMRTQRSWSPLVSGMASSTTQCREWTSSFQMAAWSPAAVKRMRSFSLPSHTRTARFWVQLQFLLPSLQ